MRARMRWLGPALVCAVLAPASAEAATLVNHNGVLTFTGAPGEDNRISFGFDRGYAYPGPLSEGQGCTADPSSGTRLTCPGVGSIVADLGDGDDEAWIGGAPTHVLGGPGDDMIRIASPASVTAVSGGPGNDTVHFYVLHEAPLYLSLETDVHSQGLVVADDFENAWASGGPATILGDAGPNQLSGGWHADSLVGGAGSDVLIGHDGDDTLDARDGERDRVECGHGTDTAIVDQYDHVGESCEQVRSAVLADGRQDLPPQLTIEIGSDLAVNASDDRGIARVEFRLGDKLLCTDTTAPYECALKPGVGDVGRRTVVATAVDSAGQTATARASLTVPRFEPESVSLVVRGRFASGKVKLPAGIPCSGRVTVAKRTTTLRSNCTYRVKVPKVSSYTARYLGTPAIAPMSSPKRWVR